MDILRAARAEADRHGDSGRPIWATEFGWATGGPPVTITVSEADQATLMHDTIVLMQRARTALALRGFVAFRWRDVPLNVGEADQWPFHAGLLRPDGSPKPALQAFSDAAAIWRREPGSGQPGPGLAPAPAPTSGQSPAASDAGHRVVAGVQGRRLRIKRYIIRRRLIVKVAVPPGGRGAPVRISYEAVRDSRIVVHRRTRSTGTRKGVARVTFKLPRSARTATLLRIDATQGTARATRILRLRSER